MTYVLLDAQDQVVNRIVMDAGSSWTPPEGHRVVLDDPSIPAYIGLPWGWRPPVPPSPPRDAWDALVAELRADPAKIARLRRIAEGA